MSNDSLCSIALLSIGAQVEYIDLDSFADEFDSEHGNRRIKQHLSS